MVRCGRLFCLGFLLSFFALAFSGPGFSATYLNGGVLTSSEWVEECKSIRGSLSERESTGLRYLKAIQLSSMGDDAVDVDGLTIGLPFGPPVFSKVSTGEVGASYLFRKNNINYLLVISE